MLKYNIKSYLLYHPKIQGTVYRKYDCAIMVIAQPMNISTPSVKI
jgi:hypothetical protein